MIREQPALNSSFTSTGAKLWHHQEAMSKLRDGKGMPIVTHIMATDICNYKCAFCSVQHREGDSLEFDLILNYLDDLCSLGLKAVILSGGGNPILYRKRGVNFADLVDAIDDRGLDIGLITNGIKLKDYGGRWSYPQLPPDQLDKLTWIRISLAGWDHEGEECYTPDIDRSKTTLGGSYVLHDQYEEPLDKHHGRVSTPDDVLSIGNRVVYGEDRLGTLKEQMREWATYYSPRYVRLLPNCLEPQKIAYRTELLSQLAHELGDNIFFVQSKPPQQPHRCLKGYPHPVLNCDGWVFPCDSVVLNKSPHSDADHKFGSPWRICRAEDIKEFYEAPIRANVPNNICPGCVFTEQVEFLDDVASGEENAPAVLGEPPEHVNFV